MLIAVVLALAIAASWLALRRPAAPDETTPLTPAKRERLEALLAARKFQPDRYYTGIATPEEGVTATATVDDVIRAVLERPDGAVGRRWMIRRFKAALRRVFLLETEDRDRTGSYLAEIWDILGFGGPAGLFNETVMAEQRRLYGGSPVGMKTSTGPARK